MTIPFDMRGLDRLAFICGCGHSGTTLVATILSRHPQIFVPLYESEAFLRDEATAVERLAHLHHGAMVSGKRILVEKTPRHVSKMDLIRQLVPGARFILLVRDGRDVAASIGQRFGGDFNGGMTRWIEDNTFVLNERHEPDVHLVRYEDIVASPRRQIRRLCTFLGATYSNELLMHRDSLRLWHGKTEIRRTSGIGDEHADLRNWQVNQPIFDGRGRWKRELPPDIIAEFEQGRAAELMQEFGYSRRTWWRRWFHKALQSALG